MNSTPSPAQNPGNTTIVSIFNGQLTTTSLAIAEGTGTQHKNVLELIRTYKTDLETFGSLAFETRVMRQDGRGGEKGEFAHLNEPQSTLILTYMKNTAVIREFKIRLVKAFFEMAKAHQQQTIRPQAVYYPAPAEIPQCRGLIDGLLILDRMKLKALKNGDQDLMDQVAHMEFVLRRAFSVMQEVLIAQCRTKDMIQRWTHYKQPKAGVLKWTPSSRHFCTTYKL